MRIILTVHQFLPDYSSGTEILTYEVAKELQFKGHNVSVFTGNPANVHLRDEERFDSYTHYGINVVRFNHNYDYIGDQTNIYEIEYNNHLVGTYFKNYLLREKPDIVHFFHLMRLSAALVDACFELGIPTAFTPTDFWIICPTCQLRLSDNRPCLGPDRSSINCLRHIFVPNQPARFRAFFEKLPNWLILKIMTQIKKGTNFDHHYSPLIRALLERKEFLKSRINYVDRVIIPTENMLNRLTQNGLEPKRAISLSYGINLTPFQINRKQRSSDTLRIGYIGTISEHKGVHVLIKAVHELAGKPIELKIYGKTDEFPDYYINLKEIAQNDPRVIFYGTFPNKDIGKIFSALDVLVVPSIWYENSPLVIHSAQAAGCPVIVSNMAGMTEAILHRRNGLLFEAGDHLQLAAAIQTLLNNRDLLKQLSKNANKPLSVEEYADKLLNIYDNVIIERTN